MARVALTIQEIAITGIIPSFASGDATNDHSAPNGNGDVFIYVKNGGAGAINVTIPASSAGPQGIAYTDPVVNIAAGVDKMIGPFKVGTFNQGDGSGIHVDLDVDTSVTLGAFRLPRV